MEELKITICGAGNGAHAAAALFGIMGHRVSIYSPILKEINEFNKNYQKNKGLTLYVKGRHVEETTINKVTNNPNEVIPQASLILMIVPAFAHRNILKNIKDYVAKDALIVAIPSRGGLEYDLSSILPSAKVVAFQTLPWACRIKDIGSAVEIKGFKDTMQVACWPGDIPKEDITALEGLFQLKIDRLQSMLTLNFANMGQVFHPGIMYGLFKDKPNVIYKKEAIPLFYQSVNEEIAIILQRMSEEIHKVAYELSKHNKRIEYEKILSIEEWLLASYGNSIKDTSTLEKLFTTNQAYNGLKVPSIQLGNGMYTPDYQSRYITEDVPYGLLIVYAIGKMMDCEMPVVQQVIENLGKWSRMYYLEKYQSLQFMTEHARLPEVNGFKQIHSLGY